MQSRIVVYSPRLVRLPVSSKRQLLPQRWHVRFGGKASVVFNEIEFFQLRQHGLYEAQHVLGLVLVLGDVFGISMGLNPFKNTAGLSLKILIKLSMFWIVTAGVNITFTLF